MAAPLGQVKGGLRQSGRGPLRAVLTALSEIGFLESRIVCEHVPLALQQHPAEFEYCCDVLDGKGLVPVLLDQKNGETLLVDLLDEIEQAVHEKRGEAQRWLAQHHEPGLGQESTADC